MTHFMRYQRVIVASVDHPLRGRSGTVYRIRHADDQAWVAMDDPLPPDLARFPDKDDRSNHVILAPEDCEAIS